MTHAERIATLANWGYSVAQAEFLVYAALGSGYFLRRQFHDRHLSGSQTEAFLNRLTNWGHATAQVIGAGRRVYHLMHGPMYRALDDAGCRNLRQHSTRGIKARVMALDYILSQNAHPLLTARDKREHFLSCGLRAEDVPVGRHPVLTDGRITTFAYIDAGHRPPGSFSKWLRAHTVLFSKLDSFRIVYVCTHSDLSPFVRRAFETAILAARPGDYDQAAHDLMEYFRARDDFESGRMGAFDHARLARLRDGQSMYAGAEYEALYERWKTDGAAAVRRGSPIAFETHVLRFSFRALFESVSCVSSERTSETTRVDSDMSVDA